MKLVPLLAALVLAPLGLWQSAGAPPRVRTLLMFEGDAEEAMELYVALVPGSKVLDVERYGAGDPLGKEGSIKVATFSLAGTEYACIDSSVDHPFTFTASTSIYVTCGSEAEVDALFAKLSTDGAVFMPLQAYPFAKKFGWCADRFGVSWQISWPG